MSSDKLTDFIEDVTGDSHLRVEDDLGDGFVRLRVSEAERRQARHDIRSSEDIVIEMLRNARDAVLIIYLLHRIKLITIASSLLLMTEMAFLIHCEIGSSTRV